MSFDSYAWEWDGYASEIINYAETHYDDEEQAPGNGSCAEFVQEVLLKVTGRSYTIDFDRNQCPGGWDSQFCYELGLQNTYGAIQITDRSHVEPGNIMTVTHDGGTPHVAFVSEYANGKLYLTEAWGSDGQKVHIHYDQTRYLSESSIKFWRIGKEKSSVSKKPDNYPTLITFQNKLYEAAKGINGGTSTDTATRYTSDGNSWSTWEEDGGKTPNVISMEVFTPSGSSPRLYQTVRGATNRIFTRYIEDGESWKEWKITGNGGETSDVIAMAVFAPFNTSQRLYQSVRGLTNRVFTRYTIDGETWTDWEITGNGGETPGFIAMTTFSPSGKSPRLYQAVRGLTNRIFTRYTEDGETWTDWEITGNGGETPDSITMTVFAPSGKSPRLYQAVRGTTHRIFTRYTEDGETWTDWEITGNGGETPDQIAMATFTPLGQSPRLYQAVHGVTNRIFTRYTEDGETWTDWEITGNGGETSEVIAMTAFSPNIGSPRLYQAVRGLSGRIFTRYTEDGEVWTDWGILSIQVPMTPSGGIASLPNSSSSILFPPNAVSQEVVIQIEELENFSNGVGGNLVLIGKIYEFTAQQISGDTVSKFGGNLEVTLAYEPSDLGNIDAYTLKIYFYDELLEQWLPLLSHVNTIKYTVTASTDHFTKFAILAPATTGGGIPEDPPPPIEPSTVPEPTTLLLFGIGILGIVGRLLVRKCHK